MDNKDACAHSKKNRGRSPACIYSQDTKGHKIKIYPAVELANVEDKEAAVLEDTKSFQVLLRGISKSILLNGYGYTEDGREWGKLDEVAAIILSEIISSTSHLFLSEFVVVIHPVHAEAMKL